MRRPPLASTSSNSRPANPSLTFPIRGVFYYPWYPGGWDQLGFEPFTRYTPTLGAGYDGLDPNIIDVHFTQMKTVGIEAAICSWWGADVAGGTTELHPEFAADAHFPNLLDSAVQRGVKMSLYYENEGPEHTNPTVSQIEADLAYLQTYFDHPAWLHVDDRPVIFVYSADDGAGGGLTTRWSDATDGYTTHYVSLKFFTGYLSEPDQPDSWHEYGPATAALQVPGFSYNISPGFWRIDEVDPRLTRDLDRWNTNIADMVASAEPWQLITSFNEWGEGTQIEPSDELGAAYLDALA